MPEQWGSRPVWQIDGEPEPSISAWLFWLTVGFVVGSAVGYVFWKVFR